MSKETERLYDIIKKSLITEKSVAATENAQKEPKPSNGKNIAF